MKNLLYIALLLWMGNLLGQEKQSFRSSEGMMMGISPSSHYSAWKLISKKYATEKILKSKGDFFHTPQFKGIRFDSNDETYYYLALQNGREIEYVTDLPGLISVMGSIDSVQEAVIFAMSKGYFPDFEHNHFAGNYEIKNGDYLFELSKVTSESCPFAKNNILLSVNGHTKTITELKDISRYYVVYGKDCENHPQNIEIAKQVEEVRLKKEEQARKQKEINAKMEKKIRKIQMKNNR